MPTASSTPTQRSISGKLFVIPFAVLIAFLLWLVFSIAVRFQVLMGQLEKTRAAWPAAVAEFQSRYTPLNDSLEQGTSETAKAKTDELLAEMKKVSQFDQQSPIIVRLESHLQENHSNLELGQQWGEATREVFSLEQGRKKLQNDFVGRCTVSSLRLIMPPIFALPEEK